MNYHNSIQERIEELKQQLVQETEHEARRLLDAGYTPFLFSSSYYGSHDECGEGDVNEVYFFAPEVDLGVVKGLSFSHGHFGESDENALFSDFIKRLSEESYVVFDSLKDDFLLQLFGEEFWQ